MKEKVTEDLKSAASFKGTEAIATTTTKPVPIEKDLLDRLEKIDTSSLQSSTDTDGSSTAVATVNLTSTNDVDIENDDLIQPNA